MNADAFRHLYEYHFTVNRKIWEQCIVQLTNEQFQENVGYSIGSARNQVVHMMNIDDRWFSGLRGEPVPDFIDPLRYTERTAIREAWDGVEAKMREYLGKLQDDMLDKQPFYEPDKDTTYLWQILIHLVNHGTDHRAQLLALLNHLGVKTFPQDYYFYVIGHM
jgi:uncharacterized damage-inducible protein DinB